MPAIEPERFVAELRERGYDFFAGVPCSLLKQVLAVLSSQDEVPYIPAAREDGALGMAAGAQMAGKRPVVLMQNSGLGVSLNALLSLQMEYELPCLLVISWRGYGGVDAPEHVIMGPSMCGILDTVGIPHKTLEPEGSAEDITAALDWAGGELERTRRPVALLARKGALA
jgi:sulfopyruvate decarboxylase alpha subunit